MKIVILLLLIFSFIFSGCSNKQPAIVFKEKFTCYELEKVEISKEEQIRVYAKDKELFQARKDELISVINFYEKQTDRFNTFCKKQLNKNFPRENMKEKTK
ncbi:hypothetical protein AAX26_01820 [Aliarcobacter thereius]|uniref:hypothetical protein n=1 Tax=Aliarcobacter thereius TaxID=544718 RepID=UPI000828F367|nr:hypothetical protein [Aliarcobacter thereius]OCL84008.1 hypothetical protein AAX27_02207 [Aliarcobacter thereius]OCL85753.1 hypothetical protein AAX26_01820 [Aliarcobacter thereius]